MENRLFVCRQSFSLEPSESLMYQAPLVGEQLDENSRPVTSNAPIHNHLLPRQGQEQIFMLITKHGNLPRKM